MKSSPKTSPAFRLLKIATHSELLSVPARFLLGSLGALGLARQRYRRGLAVRHVRVLPDRHAPRREPVDRAHKIARNALIAAWPLSERRGGFLKISRGF